MARWLDSFTSFWRSTQEPADRHEPVAAVLPPVEDPVIKKREQQSVPVYFGKAKPDERPLTKADRRTATTDPLAPRRGTSTAQVIRDFALTNPDLSAAVSAYLRTGIPEQFTLMAYNPDGTFNREATIAGQHWLSRINLSQRYEDGFAGTWTVRTTSTALAKETMYYGAMAAELVLDKAGLPAYIVPVHVPSVSFIPDKASKYKFVRPVQTVGSDEIDLDVPTFFYLPLDPLLNDFTPNSPLEPALQPLLFSTEFMSDLHRIIKRVIHPRMRVSINEERLRKMAPPEVLYDPAALQAFEDEVVSSLGAAINSLKPEEALVTLDFIDLEYVNNGNASLSAEYDVLNRMSDAKLATGAKVLPSVLGHGTGTQNVASAEALMFMKNADGTIRMGLNELYSRIATLALRLLGFDVVAQFRYAAIDLRPESELEAFRAMFQSRILDQLSLGLISDDEACILLTGSVTPAGYVPLMGTMFRQGAGSNVDNPYSGSPDGGGQSGGGALNQQLKPQTPTEKGRGAPKKK